MTTITTTADISTILTKLGFELDADDDGFVEDVARLAGAGDAQGLARRIAGNASWGEALETANSIVEIFETDGVEIVGGES